MATFPETTTRRPQYGYDNTPEDSVKRTPPEAGNSFIRDAWGKLRFVARMEFLVSLADAAILWPFYETNRLLAFTMFDFEQRRFTETLGVATGALQTFTVPAKLITNYTVFKNGVAIGAGSITYLAGAGTDGQDNIQLAAGAATAGQTITITFDGRHYYSVEFAEAATRQSVGYNRVHIGMKVRQRFPL